MRNIRIALSYLLDMIFSPTDLADDIKEEPKFILPIIANLLIIFLITLSISFTIENIGEFAKIEQGIIDTLKDTKPASLFLLSIFLLFVYLIGELLSAGFTMLLSNTFGGYASFPELLSITLHAGTIRLLGLLISIVFLSVIVDYITFDPSTSHIILYIVMSLWLTVSPFDIWRLVILTIGISRLSEISKTKAFFTTFVPTIIQRILLM